MEDRTIACLRSNFVLRIKEDIKSKPITRINGPTQQHSIHR